MQTSRWPISHLPISGVTPFTYRDGETYLSMLNRLAQYVTDQLHPSLRDTVEHMVEEMEHILAAQHGKYVEGIQDFQRIHDAFMTDVNSALMALNDNAVADLVDDPGSVLGSVLRDTIAAQAADSTTPLGGVLESTFAQRSTSYLDIAEYAGEAGRNVDSTEQIQLAIDHATDNNMIVVGSGEYRISGTIYLTCEAELSGVTLLHTTGQGTALEVGHRVGGAGIFMRRTLSLPHVINDAWINGGWDQFSGSTGVVLRNLNTCNVTVPEVMNFEKGISVYGDNTGNAYNNYYLGSLWHNKWNLVMEALSTTGSGYSNQNSFYGGRFLHNTGAVGERAPGTKHIWYRHGTEHDAGGRVNNNVFINTSLEGVATEYAIDFEAAGSNTHINNRFEFGGRVIFRGSSRDNLLLNSNYLSSAQVEHENTDSAIRNRIDSNTGYVEYGRRLEYWMNVANQTHPWFQVRPNNRSFGFSTGTSEPFDAYVTGSYLEFTGNLGVRERGTGVLGSVSKPWSRAYLENVFVEDYVNLKQGGAPIRPASGESRLYFTSTTSGEKVLAVMFDDGSVHTVDTTQI